MRNARRIVIIMFLTLITAYVSTYVSLSARGCYQPAVLGLNHVKWYSWAPLGSYDRQTDDWNNTTTMRAFFPLYALDRTYWHPSVRSNYKGPHPIDEHFPALQLRPRGR